MKDVLRKLDLGSSVAEQDQLLERFFVETEPFRAVIEDRDDVVAGDKGTGKSALYTILSKRRSQISELRQVEVISAFNPVGMPIFQKLTEADVLNEVEYIKIWKAYFLALAGNWILQLAEGDFTIEMQRLHELLDEAGLRTTDDSPGGVFSKIMAWLKNGMHLQSAEASGKLGPAEIRARVDFAVIDSVKELATLDHDDALRLLDSVLADMDVFAWLTVDRLDEAFQSRPTLERPVLRALLRAYLDMQAFKHVRIKLFVRRDLFRRIIGGGFVNLTHVNARKIEILWEDADLYSLLYKRLIENDEFITALGLIGASADDIFGVVFPQQVDPGDRKPNTWTWILGRIGDGNRVRPPRNLIDLILKAREAQLRREDREPREYVPGVSVITAEALKLGLTALSSERVEDTLLAEAGEYAGIIEHFRDGKAEHNHATLREMLGEEYGEKVKYLQTIGFLEQVGTNYKVPILYRQGLGITQGKAFSGGPSIVEDEDA